MVNVKIKFDDLLNSSGLSEKSDKSTKSEKPEKISYIDLSIYSNNDNPFNDANLGEKFVWTKKKDREKNLGLTPEEILRQEQQRREETQVGSYCGCDRSGCDSWCGSFRDLFLFASQRPSAVPEFHHGADHKLGKGSDGRRFTRRQIRA